MQLPIGDQ